MPRIAGAEVGRVSFLWRPFVRFAHWVTRRKMGTVLTSQQIAAHHSTLLFGRSMMEAAVLSSRRVDARLKTLAGVRAAMLAGCGH
jgi:hypothetical protein